MCHAAQRNPLLPRILAWPNPLAWLRSKVSGHLVGYYFSHPLEDKYLLIGLFAAAFLLFSQKVKAKLVLSVSILAAYSGFTIVGTLAPIVVTQQQLFPFCFSCVF